MDLKTSCLGTSISVDHRHDHVIIAEHIFSSWVTSPLGLQVDFPHYMSERERQSSFMWTTLDALPLSQILKVHVNAVWTVGTDQQKHKSAPMAWRTKQNLVIYIYAFSRRFYPKRLTIAFRLYIFISTCSLGIEPTTFCAADTMLYHWATQEHMSEP